MMTFLFTASATGLIDVSIDRDEESEHHWRDEQAQTDDVFGYLLRKLASLNEIEREEFFRLKKVVQVKQDKAEMEDKEEQMKNVVDLESGGGDVLAGYDPQEDEDVLF